jgi:hypothetical protein
VRAAILTKNSKELLRILAAIEDRDEEGMRENFDDRFPLGDNPLCEEV